MVGDDNEIIDSFNKHFQNISTIETKEQLASAIMMSREIKDWYLKFSESRISLFDKPDWIPLDEDGLTHWCEIQGKLEGHQKRTSEWNRGMMNAISDLRKKMTSLKNEKRKYYKNADELIVIFSLTVEDLPIEQILELVTISDLELRKEKQDRFLTELKSKYYKEWKNGSFENPYLEG